MWLRILVGPGCCVYVALLFSVTFFSRKSCHLWDNVEKSCRAGQATDDNMAHAHCMSDNKGYTHTHTHTLAIRDIYCFSTKTMVAWRRLNVTFICTWPPCLVRKYHRRRHSHWFPYFRRDFVSEWCHSLVKTNSKGIDIRQWHHSHKLPLKRQSFVYIRHRHVI